VVSGGREYVVTEGKVRNGVNGHPSVGKPHHPPSTSLSRAKRGTDAEVRFVRTVPASTANEWHFRVASSCKVPSVFGKERREWKAGFPRMSAALPIRPEAWHFDGL
jgi:hypothetical protein